MSLPPPKPKLRLIGREPVTWSPTGTTETYAAWQAYRGAVYPLGDRVPLGLSARAVYRLTRVSLERSSTGATRWRSDGATESVDVPPGAIFGPCPRIVETRPDAATELLVSPDTVAGDGQAKRGGTAWLTGDATAVAYRPNIPVLGPARPARRRRAR